MSGSIVDHFLSALVELLCSPILLFHAMRSTSSMQTWPDAGHDAIFPMCLPRLHDYLPPNPWGGPPRPIPGGPPNPGG
jgi:hypothetical protein